MMKKYWLLFLLIFPLVVFSQKEQSDSRLAQQYLQNGEYEKASVLYEKLHKKIPTNDFYFSKFLESLKGMEDYTKAEEVLKKRLKKDSKNAQLYLEYGKLYEDQYESDKAAEKFRKAIGLLPPERYRITKLANEFMRMTKYDLAAETYEKGARLLKDKYIFSYNLGELYRRKGESEKMVENYLNSVDANPGQINSVKTIFQRYLTDEEFEELQKQLYTRIQDDPESERFPEMLQWVFEQKKDFKNALRQAKALDSRLEERGGRVYKLGQLASREKDYDAAIAAYEYLIERGDESNYYLDAKQESLRCKRNKLVAGFNYTKEDLTQLESEYESFLDEFGRKKTTAKIISELADLEAFYLNNLDKAIDLLNEVIYFPGVNRQVKAEGKLSLGDFYLMKGEIWESTLLYSQVDKDFKDDLTGQEARFRNAKLSYYTGDFEWAQSQFDVLKASTSKLIANDALDLSVFIMDNLGLDTVATPMEKFAEAELYVFQNRFEEAVELLDSIGTVFPKHSLKDDILYAKSNIFYKKRDYTKAGEFLQSIIDNHGEEIRADNALFKLAQMYENEFQLNNKEKAQELYQRILKDYSNSTFSVEARKRFRFLRGDVQ